MVQDAVPSSDWLQETTSFQRKQDEVQNRREPPLEVQQGLLQARSTHDFGRPATSIASNASTSIRSDPLNTPSADTFHGGPPANGYTSSRTTDPSEGPTSDRTKPPELCSHHNDPPRSAQQPYIHPAPFVAESISGGRDEPSRRGKAQSQQGRLNDRLVDSRLTQSTLPNIPQHSSAIPSSSQVIVFQAGSKHAQADESSTSPALAGGRNGKKPKLCDPSNNHWAMPAYKQKNNILKSPDSKIGIGAKRRMLDGAFQLMIARYGRHSSVIPQGDYLNGLILWTNMSAADIENDFRERYAELDDQSAASSPPSNTNLPQPVVTGASAEDEQHGCDLVAAEEFSMKCFGSKCTTRNRKHKKPYSCLNCGAGVKTFADFHRHCESRWPRVFHRCRRCGKIFSRHINEHCRTVHEEHSDTASYSIDYNPKWWGCCEFCFEIFEGPRVESIKAMLGHVWDVHVKGGVPATDSTGHTDDSHDQGQGDNGNGRSYDDNPGSSFDHSQISARPGGSAQDDSLFSQYTWAYNYQTIKHTVRRWLVDRGRPNRRHTSDFRSPRSIVASRGVAFHDDENFKLDLDMFGMVGIGAAAGAEYDNKARFHEFLVSRTVSFDIKPKSATTRAETMRSDAPSNSTISRSCTMRSDGPSTIVEDKSHETDLSSVGSDDDDDEFQKRKSERYQLHTEQIQEHEQEPESTDEEEGAEAKVPFPTEPLDPKEELDVLELRNGLQVSEVSPELH